MTLEKCIHYFRVTNSFWRYCQKVHWFIKCVERRSFPFLVNINGSRSKNEGHIFISLIGL